jgi:hypothetical protein
MLGDDDEAKLFALVQDRTHLGIRQVLQHLSDQA